MKTTLAPSPLEELITDVIVLGLYRIEFYIDVEFIYYIIMLYILFHV